MLLILFAAIFAATYLALQLFYIITWKKIPELIVPESYVPGLRLSVIVVARNEEILIERTIRSILQQQYPPDLFELIIINDRSTDYTIEIIEKIHYDNISLFHLHDFPEFIKAPAFKKSGIELAVSKAHNPFIVVTDADCIHHPEWLKTIAYAHEQSISLFLSGPVILKGERTLLERMQQTEMNALMIITASGIKSGLHDMANGANMAFSKESFLQVAGYAGNHTYSSGDDMFLIEKMRFISNRIMFVKSKTAFVYTQVKPNWTSLINQRIRWAGKNKGLANANIKIIWSYVGLYHLTIIAMLFLPLISKISLWPFIILVVAKWIGDLILFYPAGSFFNTRLSISDFIAQQFLYMVYVFRLGWNIILGKKGDWQ